MRSPITSGEPLHGTFLQLSLLQTQATRSSPLAGAVVAALGPDIVAYLGSEENAVFAVLVGDVVAFQASPGVELPTTLPTAAVKV